MNTVIEKNLPHVRQFVKFGIVGLGNTVLDFSVYYGATRGLHLHFLEANTLSWLTAVVFSFLMNKYWTFRSRSLKGIGRQYAKFIIVSVLYLIASQSLLFTFIRFAGFHDLKAKIFTIAILLSWSFFMNKFWTFKKA